MGADALFGPDSHIHLGSPSHSTGSGVYQLVGHSKSLDIFDGGSGTDTLLGTAGSDVVLLDSRITPSGALASTPGLSSIERMFAGAGDDIVDLTSQTYTYGDVIVDGGAGNDVLWTSAGNDYLIGGDGNDVADGGWGNDVIAGGDGDDRLVDQAGNNLLIGGAGNDSLTSNSGHTLMVGGTGADKIETGAGVNIIAFNRGDGADDIVTSSTSRNVLSFGKGISYADLTLARSGNDLVLSAGGGDAITLNGWYTGSSNRTTTALQFFTEGNGYDPSSTDVTRAQKVETFDFAKLVAVAEAGANGKSGGLRPLTSWNVTNGLLTAFLSGSNSAALGGDLAFQYAQAGTFAGGLLSSTQSTLSNPQFGETAQPLQSPAGASSNDFKLVA
jgi:Ca2+-binding RTX toxin-like protein